MVPALSAAAVPLDPEAAPPTASECDWRGELHQARRRHLRHYRSEGRPSHLAGAADALLRLGLFRPAAALAQLALARSQGRCAEALLVLANLAAAHGEPRRAIPPLLALRRTERAPLAYRGLARICRGQGQMARATRLLQLAEARHPGEAPYSLALAQHHLELGQLELAWAALQRCLALDATCLEAWLDALSCARALAQPDLALAIAQRLSQLDPGNPSHHRARGQLLSELDQPLECCEAFAQAASLAPGQLVDHLNAAIPVWRIPANGSTAWMVAFRIRALARQLDTALKSGNEWTMSSPRGLLTLPFYCAYSPLNLRTVLEPYYALLSWACAPWLRDCQARSRANYRYPAARAQHQERQAATTPFRIRLGVLSASLHGHSTAAAFSGLLRDLNRDRFELILIHRQSPIVDANHLRLNGLADLVVYLDGSLDTEDYLLRSLDLDILFFLDLGFDSQDFLIPALRTCPIQITGWGVPHTSGLASIDYYLSSSWLESPADQVEYTEKLVLLDGLPGCVTSEDVQYRILSRSYFLLPEDRLIIGCVQTFWKIHPDFDLILERIARRLPDALFVFVDCGVETANQRFQERLGRRAPQASQQTVFLARCASSDFLSLCDCLDLLLDPPYFGSGVTAYLSMSVGTPTVAFRGKRLRDSSVAAIYRYLGIEEAPIAASIATYVEQVVALACNAPRRLALKRQTAQLAHRLYDNPTYVRSFERFCTGVIAVAPGSDPASS